MTTTYDPWNYIPILFLLLGSFGVPYLYRVIGSGEGSRKDGFSSGLQGVFFFIACFALYIFFVQYVGFVVPFFSLNPFTTLLFIRFIVPFLAFAIVAFNWYKFFIAPNLVYLITTLMFIGVLTITLGILYIVYLPLIVNGQSPLTYLFSLMYAFIGLIIIVTGIYIFLKKERLKQFTTGSEAQGFYQSGDMGKYFIGVRFSLISGK